MSLVMTCAACLPAKQKSSKIAVMKGHLCCFFAFCGLPLSPTCVALLMSANAKGDLKKVVKRYSSYTIGHKNKSV